MASPGINTANRENFSTLNGLRFLAAIAVVCFHYAHKIEDYDVVPEVIRKLVDDGPAAVGFFFILSGFLLASRHLRNGHRTESVGTFYWARFIRLYPAYLVGFLAFLPFAMEKYLFHPASLDAGRGVFGLAAVLYLLMLQAWTPLAQAWNGPSWSLSVEAFMYFVFPLVVVRLTKLSLQRAVWFSIAAWLLPALLTGISFSHAVPEHVWRLYIGNNPLLWTPLFLIGICLAKFLPAWMKVEERRANMIATAAFAAVFVVAVLAPDSWTELLINGGMAPLLALVVISFTRTSGWITRVVGGKTMSMLGQASYIIYIIQSPMWSYWQALTNRLRHFPIRVAVVTPWQFIFFLPFIVLVSLAVQKFIETPMRKFMDAWKLGRGPQPALSPVVREMR